MSLNWVGNYITRFTELSSVKIVLTILGTNRGLTVSWCTNASTSASPVNGRFPHEKIMHVNSEKHPVETRA